MTIHKSVLLKETIELLNLKEDSIVVDATLGGGGHSREMLKKIGDKGTLVALDVDEATIKNFLAEISNDKNKIPNKFQIKNSKIQNIGNVVLVNDNFRNLDEVLEILKIEKVDAILADLGWSSDQLEGKGMSFQKDEELDMRLALRNTKLTKYENTHESLNAKSIVNIYSEKELGRIIREYGEEKYWKNIARKIIENREKKEIETTGELAGIIESAVPGKYRHGKIHPATRTFQALRIEVNRELENLEKFIPEAMEKLAPQGRLAIISFHSLEDRIVKNIYRTNARGRVRKDDLTGREIVEEAPEIRIITKKPVVASEKEVENNPRARSAKLRVCEKL